MKQCNDFSEEIPRSVFGTVSNNNNNNVFFS